MSRRSVALAGVVTVAAGLGLRASSDGAVAKYGGDALYTVLLYVLVVFTWPRVAPHLAALVAAAASWMIEFAQLTELPAVLRPVLGSTFNPPDLFFYVIGAALAWSVHRACLAPRRPAQ